MKEFLLVFRANINTMPKGSPEEMQARTQSWMDWVTTIAAKDRLKDRGNRLTHEGRVMQDGHVITDGPYLEIKESILGYSHIQAGSFEEAVELASGCPIFKVGGTVEVREISAM